jgi:prevent-host-death family protein
MIIMKRISARQARSSFAEITDRVHYTGEPVIVDKQGQPFVAVVSLEDLDEVRRLRASRRQDEFTRLAAAAAREHSGSEPSDDEIVNSVKRTREAIHRERYAGA